MRVAGQLHAACAHVERTVGLRQAALCAQAVQTDHARGVYRALCAALVKRHIHTRRNHHIGYVGQVRHGASSPVGRVEPVTGVPTRPGDRVQARDRAGGVGPQRDAVVVAAIAIADRGRCGRQCLAGGHILVVERQCDGRNAVAHHAQLVGQVRHVSCTGRQSGLTVVSTAARLRCERDGLGRDGACVAGEVGAAEQVIVQRISALQGDAVHFKAQACAHMACAELPHATCCHRVARLFGGQVQADTAGRCAAVVYLAHSARAGSQRLGCDAVRAHHGERIAEVPATAEGGRALQAQLPGADRCLVGAAVAHTRWDERESGCAAHTVCHRETVGTICRDARQVHRRAAIEVLRAGDRIAGRAAIDRAGITHPHQQLVGRHDGETAIDRREAVVAGPQARHVERQHVGVNAWVVHRRIVASDDGAATDHRG